MKNYVGIECKLFKGGKSVLIGDKVYLDDGESFVIESMTPPHKSSSTGRIYVRHAKRGWKQEYFPSVFGCVFQEV